MKRGNTAAVALNTGKALLDVGDGIVIPLPVDEDFGGQPGSAGAGVPAGGSAFQVIRKSSAGTTTEWATPDKGLVGLDNVDNTPDAEKPVSAPQAAALGGKVAKGDLFINARDHGVTGDGITDDRGALLAAANAAVALDYPLVIPTGLTMSISSPGIAFPAGLTTNTNGAKFKTPAQTGRVPVIQIRSNTTITGGLYVTTLGGLNGSGVMIQGATNVRIDVVDVQSTIPGQGFGNVRDNGLNINNSSDITIGMIKIKNFDYAIAAESVPNLRIA
jgi:hypothetical protein